MVLRSKKTIIMSVFIAVIAIFILLGGYRYISLSQFQESRQSLLTSYDSHPLLFAGGFFGVYLLVTTLSLPVASVLTVASGAIFGWQFGSVLVVLAATLGSLGPYLLARYLFRDYLRNRYATVFKKVDQGMEQAGWTYLLSARLSAVFPFYVLNIVSGVTNITIRHYVSATFLGIIPATVVYSFAGSQIGTTTKVSELLSRGVVLSLILLALLPLVAKWVASKLKKSQQKTT